MFEVHGANGSPFVRKVKIFLKEKNLPFSQTQVAPFPPSAEFKKISPLGKIPAFKDGDKVLADSSIVCAYLERTNPQPQLYPSDAYDYARALWFEEYGDGGLAPVVGAEMFFNRVVGPRLLKLPFDEAKYEKAANEKVPPMLDYLESEIKGDFIVGKSFSIGDIGIATQFVNAQFAGYRVDEKRWPKLAAYIQRIHSRPSFKSCIEEEMKVFGS
jgi:glutathione S-transferase